jgi:prepilin-type N-terminal cleavage/methylation domain-containing protein
MNLQLLKEEKLQKEIMKIKANGFSMIEVLIAVLVVGMVMTAVAAMMVSSTKISAESKYLGFANNKVQEALEVFRRERFLLGWGEFYGAVGNGVYCYNDLPADSNDFQGLNVGGCGGDSFEGAGLSFVREATVSKVDASTVEVTINVEWLDGNRVRDVEATQVFKKY